MEDHWHVTLNQLLDYPTCGCFLFLPHPPPSGFEEFNFVHIQSQVATMKLVIARWLICYFGVLMALYIRFELTHSKLSP
jgi:hypothetical protein